MPKKWDGLPPRGSKAKCLYGRGGYVSLNSLGETPELAHHDVPAT